jgi:diguanylate cyclase (GGDEF)-like protein
LDGETVLEVSSPVRVNGEIVAALGVYLSLADREAALSALTTRLVVGPVIAVILVTALGWLGLHLFVVKRLQLMVRAGDRLAHGEMTARVAGDWRDPGRDEVAIAIDHFNNMAGSIQSLTTTLELLGVTDGLTGVHNRRFFDETLTQEVNRSRRNGAPLALMMLDIDRFKRYNDRFGHQAGDEALRRVAQALSREVRSVDFVARYGGEEFVVIMPGADTPAAAAVAERVRRAVESKGIRSPGGGPLTVSIGVAVYPDLAPDEAGLVSAADAALYAAKDGGRNRIVLAGAPRLT